ncbi:hypothetical protein PRZ48_008614 [Zasmidium cellare]|uniref:Uncharacterized protein n=1 Tax=Zasmidium cellare TaxID=395010 RepID=A0ABR0EGL3_ZASCE|nr:hypothetical protein PRZ48_008614 [Zasmidium cellare]
MPAQRSTAGASKKRKAKGEMDDDQDYRPSHTTSNGQKRKKVENDCETTSVTIDLPTKALDDILKKGAAKASQKSIRDIISKIHSQKALIEYQARPAEMFTIIASRTKSAWNGHFRVSHEHKVPDLARAIGAASGTESDSMTLQIMAAGSSVAYEYDAVDKDGSRNLKEASLIGLAQGSVIEFTATDKERKERKRHQDSDSDA